MNYSQPINCPQVGGSYVTLDSHQEIVLWFLPDSKGGGEKAIAMYRNSCLTTVEGFENRQDAISRAKHQILADKENEITFYLAAAQEAQRIIESLRG